MFAYDAIMFYFMKLSQTNDGGENGIDDDDDGYGVASSYPSETNFNSQVDNNFNRLYMN